MNPSSAPSLRRATLCSLDPVKYWSAAPKLLASTARMSTWSPSLSLTLDFVGPFIKTSFTSGYETNLSITAAGSSSPTSRSMSPTVSLPLLRLPPMLTLSSRREDVRCPRIASAIGRASPSSVLPPFDSSVRMPWSIFSSDFSPNPLIPWSLWSMTACLSCSTDDMPSSLWRIIAVFGPTSGTLSSSTRPGGTSPLSSSRYRSFPVSTISRIFLAIASPTPGMSLRRSSAASSAMSSSSCSMFLAARLYA